MLEIILDKEVPQAVKEVRWNGEILPRVTSVDISFRGDSYPWVRIVMATIPVKINNAEIMAEVQFLKE